MLYPFRRFDPVELVDPVPYFQRRLDLERVPGLGVTRDCGIEVFKPVDLHLADRVDRLLYSHFYAALDKGMRPSDAASHFRCDGLVFVALRPHHQGHIPLTFTTNGIVGAGLITHADFKNLFGRDFCYLVGLRAGVGKADVLGLTVFVAAVSHLGTRCAPATCGKAVADTTDATTDGVANSAKCIAHRKILRLGCSSLYRIKAFNPPGL